MWLSVYVEEIFKAIALQRGKSKGTQRGLNFYMTLVLIKYQHCNTVKVTYVKESDT